MYSEPEQSRPPDAAEIRRRAGEAVFGQRLIANNFRAVIVETMIASVLEPEWRWCAADWAGWDLERADGVRLEVKQSAAKQTWHSASDKPSSCSFDIRTRAGHYEGATWIEGSGRNADLYVFAHHDVCDESADHADPAQWTFYVVRANDLPEMKSIGLQKLRSLAPPGTYADLKRAVEAAAERLLQDRQTSVRTA